MPGAEVGRPAADGNGLPARRLGTALVEPVSAPRLARDGAEAETVDVVELARTVGRGWRTVLAGGLLGLVVAALLIAFFPPRYRATATVLLRNANDPAGSLLSRVGIGAEVAASAGGGLGNVLKSPMETEVQLLGSRDVLGQVSDSLGLQARVRAPGGVPSRALLRPARYDGSFRPVDLTFTRRADGLYDVSGDTGRATARPGQAAVLPVVGRVTLADGPLPAAFRVRVEDRDDAVTRLASRLTVEKQGGEVASLTYAGPDSLTAAAVPNAVIAVYLERRRTVDRGLNQRRYELLSAQADSLSRQLQLAEDALRRQQDRTGLFDPEIAGKATFDALNEVLRQSGELEGERLSARRVVDEAEAGTITPRQLAAFPTFLKSAAFNNILAQITQVESERTRLLERRTERDPEVVVLSRNVADLERQLLPLARTYTTSLDRQSAELGRQAAALRGQLAALPGQAEGTLRGEREVKRLSQTVVGLQTQVIDTRLAAMSEGGQVRQVDEALPPKKILFPRPLPTLLVALALGLLVGTGMAAVGAAAGSALPTAGAVERAVGLPVVPYAPGMPLLLGPGARAGTVHVIPVGATPDVAPVARQLVEHARERGHSAVLVDLAAAAPGAGAAAEAAHAVASAEAQHALVVETGPGMNDRRTAAVLDPSRAVVLVARAGRARRDDLAEAAAAIERLALTCLGVVLVERAGRTGVSRDVTPASRAEAYAGNGAGRSAGNGAGH